MNRKLIIAELRRSAIQDQRPWIGVQWQAGLHAMSWVDECDLFYSSEDVAMFFLLVAEMMEQE